jgi:uncharacterized OB-fold protein
MTGMRRMRPPVTRDNAFFWEGLARSELRIQRCAGCGRLRHPPGPMCPACRSLEWEAVPASGAATLYSFVVAHHPPIPPFSYPHPVALVELAEGVRVVSEVVGIEPGELRIGMPLRLEFAEVEAGFWLHRFRPDGDA